MKKSFLSVAAAALMFAACNEPLNDAAEVEIPQTGAETDEVIVPDNGMIVLGEKLPNPYSLDNMRKAIEELNKSSLSKSVVSTDIKPTHYYMRFKPKNEAEVDKLDADTTIFFYDYPLDYDIIQEGDYYHAPELPDSVPTYQYCAVEVGHKLPDVEHEILEELYILEDVNVYENGENKNENSISKHVRVDYWDELETIAQSLVGYEVELSKKRKEWKPEGYIRYQDSEKGVIPMEGVPVHMRKNMFVGYQCCTDKKGYFSFSKIKAKVEFLIRWKRDNFKVKNTSSTAANVMLKKNTRSSIDITFNIGETQWRYASAFRGAWYYYYGDIYPLSRPPKDMRIHIYDSNNDSTKQDVAHCGSFEPVGGSLNGTEITVYSKGLTSRDIFGVTIAQLGKSLIWAIYRSDNDFYNRGVDENLKNAWACCCAEFLTNCYYWNKRNMTIKKKEDALRQTCKYQEWLELTKN